MVTPLQGFSTAGKHSPDRALVDTSRRGIGPGRPGATLIPDGGEKKRPGWGDEVGIYECRFIFGLLRIQ